MFNILLVIWAIFSNELLFQWSYELFTFQVKELDAPDVDGSFEDFEVEKKNEYSKTRTQEFVDQVKENGEVSRKMRYDAETTEGKRHGDADWESLSARLRRNRNR